MRMAFHAPFKPLGHPRLSGDVTIARDLFGFFQGQGHDIEEAAGPVSEWLFWRPQRWPQSLARLAAARARLLRHRVEALITYHSYYRSPDLLGPLWAGPGRGYFIFAGAYATKRRRRLKTWPGFQLNRLAHLRADHVFANKREDYKNLKRLLDHDRLSYVRPGIRTSWFHFDEKARHQLRKEYGLGDDPTVVCAAMFRPGVKVQGLEWTIRTCGELLRQGTPLRLLLAGDGPAKSALEALARRELGERARFCGMFGREELHRFYSAGDVFVFPGISEGLGMAYLEAQCCGLPAVAWDHDGAPEVILHGETGYVTPSWQAEPFSQAVAGLLKDPDKRRKMGERARQYVLSEHDLFRNYRAMEEIMLSLVAAKRGIS